jgi:hypothetical protein
MIKKSVQIKNGSIKQNGGTLQRHFSKKMDNLDEKKKKIWSSPTAAGQKNLVLLSNNQHIFHS